MRWLLALIVQLAAFGAAAQDTVHFPGFDGDDGHPRTELAGYLFKARRPDPAPAVVFLHGCSGLISGLSHQISTREVDWAGKLNAQGYAVLMVDSFAPRGVGEMCSTTGFKEWLYLRRPGDAYAGLAWLQQQPFVARDRIAMVGWSNGGGAVLFALGRNGRPARFAGPDFRAAIAFYPGSCSEQRLGRDWTPAIPLMVLIGGKDVWTPAKPCRELVDGAAGRGASIAWQIYPDAWHDFDWPNLKRRELSSYTTRAGVVPITGEDPAAHADAIQRVQGFLAQHIALH